MHVRTGMTRQTPWSWGSQRCFAWPCLGQAFQSIESRLCYDVHHAVPRPGFFELLIAAQALQHRTPSKVGEPRFPQGIPVSVSSLEKSKHRNLLCLWLWREDQWQYIALDWQVFYCIRPFKVSFGFQEMASCNFYKVLLASQGWSTQTVQQQSMLFHLKESLWVSHGSEEFCWCSLDQFLLTNPQCQVFYVTEFSPGSFPSPTKLHLYIFSTVVGLPFLPVHSLEWAVQLWQFPVGFGSRMVKPFHVVDRKRNSW